jgi:hypothetical protein
LNFLFFNYYDLKYNNDYSIKQKNDNFILRLHFFRIFINTTLFIDICQSYDIYRNLCHIIQHFFIDSISNNSHKISNLIQYIDSFIQNKMVIVSFNIEYFFILLKRILYECKEYTKK